LAAGAVLYSIPPGFILRGLQALEGLIGCGNIVNWEMLNQIGNVATTLSLLP
jgi:hypothetical protein